MWWLLKMWRRWCPRLTSGPGVGGCSDDGQLGALVNPSLSIALSPLGGFQFFAWVQYMYTILVFVFFVTFDLAFWVPCWWDLPARECQAFWCLQAVKVAPPVLSLCDYSVQIFAHWLHFWNLPLLQVVFAFSHHGQMGAGAISLPDRGYLGEKTRFNYLPAEPQTPRSPHPPDNFCQILLARQEALDGEGQWSRGWEEVSALHLVCVCFLSSFPFVWVMSSYLSCQFQCYLTVNALQCLRIFISSTVFIQHLPHFHTSTTLIQLPKESWHTTWPIHHER